MTRPGAELSELAKLAIAACGRVSDEDLPAAVGVALDHIERYFAVAPPGFDDEGEVDRDSIHYLLCRRLVEHFRCDFDKEDDIGEENLDLVAADMVKDLPADRLARLTTEWTCEEESGYLTTDFLTARIYATSGGPYRLTPIVVKKPPGRNAPCPCGSKKKFKKCCWWRSR